MVRGGKLVAVVTAAEKRVVARWHASYVLDWLRQTHAPDNIVRLQEQIVGALGGYVGPFERAGGQV